MRFGAAIVLNLKLEREIHRRIDEPGDRRKGNYQLRRNLVEAQPHFKPGVIDAKIPIFVLENNRHLVREAFGKMFWNIHAGRGGFEGDIEMMAAGKAACAAHFAKHTPHDGAKRLLDDLIIRNQAIGRLVVHAP